MSALNSVYSSSKLTVSGQDRVRSSAISANSGTTKNLIDVTINYKLTFPFEKETPKITFDTSNIKFQLTVPSSLLLSTKEVFNQTVAKPSPFADRIQADADDSNQPALGSLVLSSGEVISEFSGHVRESFSRANDVFGVESPTELAALGFTSGFSIIFGGMSIKNGVEEFKTAQKVSDAAGQQLGVLKIAKGASYVAGGTALVPARALAIASLSSSAKIISTMAGVLGTVGGAFFSIASIVLGVVLAIKLNEHRQFRQELNAILDNPALTPEQRNIQALEHLKKLASVSPGEKAEILQKLEADPAYQAMNPQERAAQAAVEEKLLLKKKEAFLKRVSDQKCIDAIRQKGPADAASVIDEVNKQSLEKVILSSIAMALVVIGLAVTVAAFIFTGPIGIIALSAIALTVSLSWLILDGYELAQEFINCEPGRYDKLWILLSTVIAAISVTLVFVLSGGIAPIIAAALVGAVWLAINSICYYRIYQLEKKKQANEL